MSKKTLQNGVALKVSNRSGFDKGFFNALTTGVGTLTPLVKQLLIPSSGKCSIKISAQLPPLASDAFLRSHLKVEAFAVPLRICYGGFESWLCGREVWDPQSGSGGSFLRAKLPFAALSGVADFPAGFDASDIWADDGALAAGTLHDYFGVSASYRSGAEGAPTPSSGSMEPIETANDVFVASCPVNIFPYISYQLIYDEWYRNKLVQKPLFSPPAGRPNQGASIDAVSMGAGSLPYWSSGSRVGVVNDDKPVSDSFQGDVNGQYISGELFNGNLFQLRQRNYGDDYFTAATPSAQEGSPAYIDTSGGGFTIGAIRMQNALQEFREASNYASPDYIQTLVVRWGVAPSMGVAQKPILLGSADFPMYTSGVEQTAEGAGQSTNNPFDTVGTRFGRGHAEGTDFVCDFDVKEPSYLMVLVSLVPEATYTQGLAHDMQIFTEEGSIVDLPMAQFEGVGNEPIFANEIDSAGTGVFGYVQRFLWHKLGNLNQAHGLFKYGKSLSSFVVQRVINTPSLNTSFLQVKRTDLDNVAAVSAGISQYGVMVDSRIDLFVSEPLSESAIPSLSDPAKEHGHSVYVKTGGSKLA